MIGETFKNIHCIIQATHDYQDSTMLHKLSNFEDLFLQSRQKQCLLLEISHDPVQTHNICSNIIFANVLSTCFVIEQNRMGKSKYPSLQNNWGAGEG